MFFELPKLSDRRAYELYGCLEKLLLAVESHYSVQLKRCYKKMAKDYMAARAAQTNSDEECPF